MNLDAALDALGHHEAQRRDLAAAELGDLLRSTALDQADAERAVTRLVAIAVNDADPVVRESALNSISEAFNNRELPLRLVQPLQHCLESMEPALLEHALYILACTHDPRVRTAIEALLNHPDAAVRRDATDALIELSGRRTAT